MVTSGKRVADEGWKGDFFSLRDPFISSEFSHVHVYQPLYIHTQGKVGKVLQSWGIRASLSTWEALSTFLCVPPSATTCGMLALFWLVLGIHRWLREGLATPSCSLSYCFGQKFMTVGLLSVPLALWASLSKLSSSLLAQEGRHVARQWVWTSLFYSLFPLQAECVCVCEISTRVIGTRLLCSSLGLWCCKITWILMLEPHNVQTNTQLGPVLGAGPHGSAAVVGARLQVSWLCGLCPLSAVTFGLLGIWGTANASPSWLH